MTSATLPAPDLMSAPRLTLAAQMDEALAQPAHTAPVAQVAPIAHVISAMERAGAGPFFGLEPVNPEANWTDGLGEALILMHSGELVQRFWKAEAAVPGGGQVTTAAGRFSHRVVTPSACEHLFDDLVLHPAASLRSVFTLLKSSPDLVRTFKRLEAPRILEAGLHALERDANSVPLVDLSEVEFIALYRPLQRTAGGDEIQGLRVRARGVGAVQPANLFEGGYLTCRAGGRIEYDLAETPLRSLMEAPLKLDALVHIGTGAGPADAPGLDMVCTELQLGELIAAVLGELASTS